MSKVEQLTYAELQRLRRDGDYKRIMEAQAAGELNEIMRLPVPDALPGDDEPWTLEQLRKARESGNYKAVQDAMAKGQLDELLKGQN